MGKEVSLSGKENDASLKTARRASGFALLRVRFGMRRIGATCAGLKILLAAVRELNGL